MKPTHIYRLGSRCPECGTGMKDEWPRCCTYCGKANKTGLCEMPGWAWRDGVRYELRPFWLRALSLFTLGKWGFTGEAREDGEA